MGRISQTISARKACQMIDTLNFQCYATSHVMGTDYLTKRPKMRDIDNAELFCNGHVIINLKNGHYYNYGH